MVFTFLVLAHKYRFWGSSIHNIKIFRLSWNLVPKPIWVCTIQWWCSLFQFLNVNTLSLKIWSRKSKLFVLAEMSYLDYFEYAGLNGDVRFFCFGLEILFLEKFDAKNQKILNLCWNLVSTIIHNIFDTNSSVQLK